MISHRDKHLRTPLVAIPALGVFYFEGMLIMKTVVCGRPLTFGDVEQIAHINALQAKEIDKAEREKKMANGELVEFEVDLRVEGAVTVTVEASSIKEARRLAEEDVNFYDIDIDEIEIEECRAI